MSAYLFIQTTSQAQRISRDHKLKTKVKVKKGDKTSTPTDARSLRSGSSSGSSSRSTMRKSTTAVKPVQSSSFKSNSISPSEAKDGYVPLHERKKKVYDINTDSYVYKTIPLSPLVQRISEFEQKFESLMRESKYHKLNELLNKYRKDSGELLFSVRNANILRYTYFEEFINDYQYIQLRTNQFRRNGVHKLKYMRKITKISSIAKEINGFPSTLSPNSVENLGDLKTDDESEGEGEDEVDDIDMLYRLNKFSLTDQKRPTKRLDKQVNVRTLFNSIQFWNNVYQDLKFDSIQSNSPFNYFERLPSINQTMVYFSELIDYVLYNLFILSGNPTNLESAVDVQTIQNYNFFYYKDFSYEFLNLMRAEHLKMYNDQLQMNDNFNGDTSKAGKRYGKISQPKNVRGSISSDPGDEDELAAHKKLITKLIDTIIENLRSSSSISQSNSRLNNFDDLFGLWENLLKFIMLEVIISNPWDNKRNPIEATAVAEERELKEESEREDDDHHSILNYYEMSGASKSRSSNKVNRNESISSKSTNQSIMSSQRYDSFASSVSSATHQNNGDIHTIMAGFKSIDESDDMKTTILPPPSSLYSTSSIGSPVQSGFNFGSSPSVPPQSPYFSSSAQLTGNTTSSNTSYSETSAPSSPTVDKKVKKSIFSKFKKSEKTNK